MKTAVVVRLVLTVLMVWLVYGETGPVTAGALLLITVRLELDAMLWRQLKKDGR